MIKEYYLLAILESEEYIRKTDISIKNLKEKENKKKFHHKPFFEYFKSQEKITATISSGALKISQYQLIGVESK